jgi:hypothetical protein
MISSIIAAGHWGWCCGALWVLKDRDEQFHEKCRGYCGNSRTSDGTLLIESLIFD